MRFFSIPSFARPAGPEYSRISEHEDSGPGAQTEGGDEGVLPELSADTRSERLRALRRTFFVYILPAIVLLLILLVAFVVVKICRHSEDEEPDDSSEFIANDARLEKYQTPSDAQYCMPWLSTSDDLRSSSNMQTAQISFDFTASDLLFFISRGSPTKGHLAITARTSRLKSIVVNVTAEYSDLEDLKKAKACFAGEQYSESGIMIWADSASRLPTFNISVEIPWIRFRDFSTDFSAGVYSQEIGGIFDIWKIPVTFEVFRMRGANGAIDASGVFTRSAFIQTTNATVSASFFSSDVVHIHTTNSPIRSMVWALGQAEGAMTEVSMMTEDAYIFAALNLGSEYKGVKLNASLHTTNGVVNMTMPRGPVLGTDYTFNVYASTTNAASNFFLSPDYAGKFDLQTSHSGTAHVQWDPTMRDPLGKGRKHVLDMETNDDGHKSGKFYWGEEEPSTLGEIRMKSTEQDVWLYTNYDAVGVADVFSLYGQKL